MTLLKLEALTREGFAPFGDVIETAGIQPIPINCGATERYHDLAAIDCAAGGGKTILSLFRSTPPAYPFTLKVMENHPLGTQAFVPLGGRPYLVVVAPKGPFDARAIRAFHARGDQGINYARGTWHHFNLALCVPSDFLVIDRSGPGDNCTEISLEPFGPIILDPVDAS